MLDEATRKQVDLEVAEIKKRYAKMLGFEGFSVDQVDMPDGKRIVVTTYITYAGIEGAGHAIMNRCDRLDMEVGLLLSSGRAFLSLGDKFVRKGMERSSELDRIAASSKESAKMLIEILKRSAMASIKRVKVTNHEARLEDALRSGAVIGCVLCHKHFGIKGKRTKRHKSVGLPKGMKKQFARSHLCPHCGYWTANINDVKNIEKAIDEFRAKSQPPQTGAQGGEPGPSVPTGTEGKAVTPQGDDGQAPLPNICLTCSRHCKKDKYTCMDYAKAHICSTCGKPIMDGDQYYSTGPEVGKIYHHPRCTPEDLMERASKATREVPEG